MSGTSQNFSSSALQDVISEESPPAYTPYPNSGERSMAFGPARAFGETPYQPLQNSTSQYPVCPPGGFSSSPLMQSHITAIHYPTGFTCAICNNSGYERPGVACQKCVSSFGVPADTSYSGIYQPGLGYSTFNSGNVVYAQPGDPSIGGQLCTSCKGSGKQKILLEIILCTKCQGVGRVFK